MKPLTVRAAGHIGEFRYSHEMMNTQWTLAISNTQGKPKISQNVIAIIGQR